MHWPLRDKEHRKRPDSVLLIEQSVDQILIDSHACYPLDIFKTREDRQNIDQTATFHRPDWQNSFFLIYHLIYKILPITSANYFDAAFTSSLASSRSRLRR